MPCTQFLMSGGAGQSCEILRVLCVPENHQMDRTLISVLAVGKSAAALRMSREDGV